MEYKVGDVIHIDGNLGFSIDPVLKILEVAGNLIKVIPVHRIGDTDGLLSHMNESWHSVDLLKIKKHETTN